MTYFWTAYILMGIITARFVFMWINDHREWGSVTFLSTLAGALWPLVWLVRFIAKGFANPCNPWYGS